MPTPTSTKTLLSLILMSCVSLASEEHAPDEQNGVSGKAHEMDSADSTGTDAATEAATPLPMKRLDQSAQEELRKAIRASGGLEATGTDLKDSTRGSRGCNRP